MWVCLCRLASKCFGETSLSKGRDQSPLPGTYWLFFSHSSLLVHPYLWSLPALHPILSHTESCGCPQAHAFSYLEIGPWAQLGSFFFCTLDNLSPTNFLRLSWNITSLLKPSLILHSFNEYFLSSRDIGNEWLTRFQLSGHSVEDK